MRTLDTDIGTDVDDLIALVTSWGSGIEFDAVTTVYGDAALRAEIVRDAYARADRRCPLTVAGAPSPLSGRPVFWAGHEGAALAARETPATNPDPRRAAETLGRSDEILAIGPLTNVALSLRQSSPVADRRLVVMGGDFSGRAEHNIICDVVAADEVFRSGVPIDVIGTDQTERVALGPEILELLPPTAVGDLLRGEIGRFRRFVHAEGNAPHDALAVLLLESPARFDLRRGRVIVDTDPARAGHVRFEPDEGGPHRIVADLDASSLRDEIVERMLCGAA
jgi:purine nucleosidase